MECCERISPKRRHRAIGPVGLSQTIVSAFKRQHGLVDQIVVMRAESLQVVWMVSAASAERNNVVNLHPPILIAPLALLIDERASALVPISHGMEVLAFYLLSPVGILDWGRPQFLSSRIRSFRFSHGIVFLHVESEGGRDHLAVGYDLSFLGFE